jgi:ribonucleotide reductase alpha subunit
MTKHIQVTKRDGNTEPLDLDKIHRVISWAVKGLEGVSVSTIELQSRIQFYDGITTSDIHETIIKSAADLISTESPDYQYVAARLAMYHLRKRAFGSFTPPSLELHINTLVKSNHYDKHILEDYSSAELSELEDSINHARDFTFSYAGVKQLEGKYLLQNRVTGQIYESPQFIYMLVSLCLFASYPRETRLQYVKDFYEATSTFKLSLPTPILGGVRTPSRQFSSCVLLDTDDSLDSINSVSSAIVNYISQRAGIGVNVGRIRALGSEIRGGEAKHTGLIPFIKLFQASVKSCSQGAIRGGAATLFYPLWHLEVESLLVLKNNRGVEENRVRHLDYGVQINKLMYQRMIEGGTITLFSPSDVPNLYDSFFSDQDEFERLYKIYESDPSIRKKSIPAIDLFVQLAQERAQTGRIYIQNVDHCNTHSPFDPNVAPIRQSNLCVAPETQVLTTNGYIPIAELDGTKVQVWNGIEWSSVHVHKTGTNQKLLKVTTSSGQTLECTEYHKWYIYDEYSGLLKVKRTVNLEAGDKLIKASLPSGELVPEEFNKVISVTDEGRTDDTYCFTEPKRGMGMFNGILTGNCLEIALPTTPLGRTEYEGEIALCTLSAFNLGAIDSLDELEHLSNLIVRALDNLLDYQNYPVSAAVKSGQGRRPLGVGVTNLAYYLAKNGVYYSNGSANNLVHRTFEAVQFYLLRASNKLARETEPCEYFHETTYATGVLPIDTYKSDVDTVCNQPLLLDWESLRSDITEHGLRNSTLSSLMPCESSSILSNSTNGIEPPRGYVSVKSSKDGVLKQVVPEYLKLKQNYELLWDIPNNTGYLELVAIMQKFVDQAISANTNYDPTKFIDSKVPIKQVLQDILYSYKLGLKTLYYHNTRDGASDQAEVDDGCASGACKL